MSRRNFSERMGLVEQPSQMGLRELRTDLRVKVWSLIYKEINSSVILYANDLLSDIAKDWVISFQCNVLGYPLDEIKGDRSEAISRIKTFILNRPYNEVLDALEHLLFEWPSEELHINIAETFENHRAAYRLNCSELYFYPVSTQEQASAMDHNLKVINESNLPGTKLHLRNAAQHLKEGRFPEAVRDSIHAVESIVCVITNKPKATLSDAIKKINIMHPSLTLGLEKLYAYTNDERGIRHASIDDGSNVDEADALFMYGACASFCSYLILKNTLACDRIEKP